MGVARQIICVFIDIPCTTYEHGSTYPPSPYSTPPPRPSLDASRQETLALTNGCRTHYGVVRHPRMTALLLVNLDTTLAGETMYGSQSSYVLKWGGVGGEGGVGGKYWFNTEFA